MGEYEPRIMAAIKAGDDGGLATLAGNAADEAEELERAVESARALGGIVTDATAGGVVVRTRELAKLARILRDLQAELAGLAFTFEDSKR